MLFGDAILSSIHTLAALLFVGLASWQADRWRDRAARAMICGCVAVALWATMVACLGVASPAAQLTESLRNLAWLSFLHILMRRGGSAHRTLGMLYSVLAFVVAATAVFDLLTLINGTSAAAGSDHLLSLCILRMVFAVGALVAVHNLYTATTSGARAGISLALAAIGVLWAIDLTFYALCWTRGGWVTDFAALRGLITVGLAPLLALAARRNTEWTIRLSRTVAFRSIGLVAAIAYLGLLIVAANAVETLGGSLAHLIPPIVVAVATALVTITMISPRARAWASVMLSKHLFTHRYDYRAEWLRFTDTLGIPGCGAECLDVRVIKAVADIVHAPGGLLLVPTAEGLTSGVRWQWSTLMPSIEPGGALLATLLSTGRVVELDPLRAERGEATEAAAIPEWIMAEPTTWAIVPLVHFDRLVGAVLLEQPLIARSLDWEDFDLLRLAGRQVASYLAEASAQESLNDAARFDEFNRRFAFIIHDIKNLVSQLTLVTRNAERHAEKPEFRADMIATLKSSSARMNDLLARLSQHHIGRTEEPRVVSLCDIATSVAATYRPRHPVVVMSGSNASALADPVRLGQALAHLVQNAIEASPSTEPVTLMVVRRGNETGIEVADKGSGMSPDFVRSSLFKPFTSTKVGGFGVGAYEARSLIAAMKGRIGISTVVGEGTRMTIWLPEVVSDTRQIDQAA